MQLQRGKKTPTKPTPKKTTCANYTSPLGVARRGPGAEEPVQHGWLGTALGHQAGHTWLEGTHKHLCEKFLWRGGGGKL